MADRGSKILGVDLPHGREGEGIFALNDNAGNQNRREICSRWLSHRRCSLQAAQGS